MASFEVFEQNISEMLNHLYDPVFRPPDELWKTLAISRERGLQALREVLLAGIEDLKPNAQVPLTTRAWRIYGILRYHYVEDLPQEATAEKLGITARHLRRSFSEAIHALSLVLWEKTVEGSFRTTKSLAQPIRSMPGDEALAVSPPSGATVGPVEENASLIAATPGEESAGNKVGWHEQLVRELEALEETSAGMVSNVQETLSSVLRLASHLTKQHEINLRVDPISPRLMAAIHPSALRQILISVIDQLSRQMEPGEIHIIVDVQDDELHIRLSGAPLASASDLSGFEAISEMLASFNVSVQVILLEKSFQITLALLKVDRCVLVIDDNMDMAHLYRRYLAGTRYYIQHINRAEKAFEAIQQYQPDLIVLDVMLPDIDGWDLLTRLHENPSTRSLPVMICTVMREKELAQALGARYFLTKPIQRQDFIQALDEVLQTA